MVARGGIYGDLHGDGREVQAEPRACTCHPDDAPIPCERKHGATHCWRSAVYKETRLGIVELKNKDRNPAEQALLNYMMRVERAVLE